MVQGNNEQNSQLKKINKKDLLSKIELLDDIEVIMNSNDSLQYASNHNK